MRTTLTLEPPLDQMLKQAALDAGVSFKQMVNDTLRAGFEARKQAEEPIPVFVMPTYNLGGSLVDLTKANALSADLEDQEYIRKHELLMNEWAESEKRKAEGAESGKKHGFA